MKKKYLVSFKGNNNTWNMFAVMTPREADYMRADGLQVFELIYVWPEWVETLGLESVWMFASDISNFRNPFKRKIR